MAKWNFHSGGNEITSQNKKSYRARARFKTRKILLAMSYLKNYAPRTKS